MSFYGTSQFIITDAFSNFIIDNAGKDEMSFPDSLSSDKISINAHGRTSPLELTTGNRWIALEADADSNILTFYHTAPGAGEEIILLEHTDSAAEIAATINLAQDNYLSFPIMERDAAGHIVVTDDKKYFYIPKLEIAANIEGLAEQIKNLQEQDEEFEQVLIGTKNQVENNIAEINYLKNNQQDISDTKNTVEEHSENIAEILKNLNQIQSEIGDFSALSEIEGIDNNATISSLIAQLWTTIANTSTIVINLQADIIRLEQEIENLKDN